MKRFEGFKHWFPIAFVFVLAAGCATVNSESASRRLSVVRSITDQDELYAAIEETRYDDVRKEAVARLTRSDLLERVVRRSGFDTDLRQEVVGRIADQPTLARIVLSKDLDSFVRKAALVRISDESICRNLLCVRPVLEEWVLSHALNHSSDPDVVLSLFLERSAPDAIRQRCAALVTDQNRLTAVVSDRSDATSVRRAALNGIKSTVCFERLLSERPPLEDWICRAAVREVRNEDVLSDTVLCRDFPKEVRREAIGRIRDQNRLERLFLESSDPLPVMESLSSLPEGFLRSEKAQKRLVGLLRETTDASDRGRVLLRLDGNPQLEKPSMQKLIAETLVKCDSEELRRFAEDNLFDSDAIAILALEGVGETAIWALSLRPDSVTSARIALESDSVEVQCRALSLVSSDAKVAEIAEKGPSGAVRKAAVSRLGASGIALIESLAKDSDPVVREAARARLLELGQVRTADALQNEEEAMRRRAEEAAAAEKRRQEEADRRAETELAQQTEVIIGESQVRSFQHFIDARTSGKVSNARSFSFTGRVREIKEGGLLSGKNRILLVVPAGNGESFQATILFDDELPTGVKKGDLITLEGEFDSGDAHQAELRHGVLVSRGVPL